MAGFRCGVFLFNLDAIDYSISVSNPEATLENFDGASSNSSDDECGENDREQRTAFLVLKLGLREAMTCQIHIWIGFVFIILNAFLTR